MVVIYTRIYMSGFALELLKVEAISKGCSASVTSSSNFLI